MNLGELQKKHTPTARPVPAPTPQIPPSSTDATPSATQSSGYSDDYHHQPPLTQASTEASYLDDNFEDDPFLPEHITRKKGSKVGFFVGIVALAGFIAVALAMYRQEHTSDTEKSPVKVASVSSQSRAKPDFGYFQPKQTSSMKRESTDTAYDAKLGILSFKVILPDAEVILLSEQKQPANFASDFSAFDTMLARMGTAKTLNVGAGSARIILGKSSTTDGPTLAYNVGGLLVFGRATQSLTPESWKEFVGGLELVQP